jgi:hypothetical protein
MRARWMGKRACSSGSTCDKQKQSNNESAACLCEAQQLVSCHVWCMTS